MASLADLKRSLAISAHGMTREEAHATGVCIDCKEPVSFGDWSEDDRGEYMISATCPRCWDRMAEEMENAEGDQPTMTCPRCKAELPDFDGFGVLAHVKPAYEDGCGFCTHPSRDDGVCGLCGDGSPSAEQGGRDGDP